MTDPKPNGTGKVLRAAFALSPILVLAWTLYFASVPIFDPTEGLAKEWLSVEPSVNPLAFHEPFKMGSELVYESFRKTTPVRAIMGGTVKISDHGLELLGTNATTTVTYRGITSLTVRDGDVVKCRTIIGTLEPNKAGSEAFLQVRANRADGSPIPPPTRLRTLQLPFPIAKR